MFIYEKSIHQIQNDVGVCSYFCSPYVFTYKQTFWSRIQFTVNIMHCPIFHDQFRLKKSFKTVSELSKKLSNQFFCSI